MRNRYIIVFLLILTIVLAGCSEQSNVQAPVTNAINEDGTINWEKRIEANKAVGEITYMTGYYYAASPPDIQVVLAKQLGYFDELGLNVNILPGLDAEGMKLLAANKAHIASAGSPSIVLQAISQGAPIEGIATFGHVGTSALMVMDDSPIYEPADLVGKSIGYHGAIPANMLAMFASNNIDVASIKAVSVGYDLSVLINGRVDALTVYKSNEPYMMEKLGHNVRIIDPGQYGAETSFGVIAANKQFANNNQAAVEDFLRAAAKAHEYAVANPEQAIDILAELSDTVYDKEAELNRWLVELELLQTEKPEHKVIGYQTDEQWEREIKMLLDAGVIPAMLNTSEVMNNAFIDAIGDGSEVVWPTAKQE